MAVDGDIGEIGQKLGGAVLPLDLLEKLRRGVYKPGRIGIILKARMADDSFEKG